MLPRLRCNEHSLLLGSYLFSIGRIENPSCSACRHSSQDTSHLILHCPATDSLCHSLFGHLLFLYDLWSRPWGLLGFWGSMVFRHAPLPRKGSGKQQQHDLVFPVFLSNFFPPSYEISLLQNRFVTLFLIRFS